MKHQLRLFFIALQFLTRLPIPRWVGFEPAWLQQAARYFPAVGLCVGLAGAAAFGAAHALFGPLVAALLGIAATVLVTGGFHEDGFADTCDGLGGAVARERALEIMKDSRIGAYGAMGLVLMLGLKAAALSSLPALSAMAACVLAHTASRAAAVAMIRLLPYAGDAEHAKAKPLARQARGSDVAVACATALAVAALLVVLSAALPQVPWVAPWRHAACALAVAIAMTAWCARWLRRRLGGVTGDTLGATQQLVEVAMLLAWLGVSRWS